MEAAVRTSGLRKAFRGTVALHGLDLVVPTGSVFGYLGPNGAGKTTTIRLLTGLLRPTSGTAEVLGLDVAHHPDEVQRRVGYLPGRFVAYPDLTGAEYLRYLAALRGGVDWSGIERLSERFDLDLGRRIGTLSHGNRQKVGLVQAFMHRPDLLVLDEPTTGLDPEATENVLQALVGHAADRGTTVFFSSHQLADVEQIADHVAIIDRGRTVVTGGLDDLRQQYRRIQLVFDGDAPAFSFQSKGVERVRRSGRVLTVLSSAGADAVLAEARALNPVSTDSGPVTLKDIFLDSVAVED